MSRPHDPRGMGACQVGPEICVFKTHVDILSSWDAATGAELRRLADKHGARPACTLRCHLREMKIYFVVPVSWGGPQGGDEQVTRVSGGIEISVEVRGRAEGISEILIALA